MKDEGIFCEGVTVCLGKENVLEDVTLTVPKGLITGILGRNGSGKTMLLKAISGLVPLKAGSVVVSGRRVGQDCDFPLDIGVVLEAPGFLPQYTGKKNLELLAGIRKKISGKQIDAAMARVGLEPGLKKPVGAYSLGMKQRLAIAQAIMEEPEVLLFDEPANGLDLESVQCVRRLFLELEAQNKTIVIATHSQEDLDLLCKDAYRMERGRLTPLRGRCLRQEAG